MTPGRLSCLLAIVVSVSAGARGARDLIIPETDGPAGEPSPRRPPRKPHTPGVRSRHGSLPGHDGRPRPNARSAHGGPTSALHKTVPARNPSHPPRRGPAPRRDRPRPAFEPSRSCVSRAPGRAPGHPHRALAASSSEIRGGPCDHRFLVNRRTASPSISIEHVLSGALHAPFCL